MNTIDQFVAAIVADPPNRELRLVFADWLEENSKPVLADQVRETAAIWPEGPFKSGSWYVWRALPTNDVQCPTWLYARLAILPWWDSLVEGMKAIMDAVLQEHERATT